jgi:hypothetical protein
VRGLELLDEDAVLIHAHQVGGDETGGHMHLHVCGGARGCGVKMVDSGLGI